MDLARPWTLILLLLIPAILWDERRLRARRDASWTALGQPCRPARLRSFAFVASLLIVALSGPRIGSTAATDTPPGMTWSCWST